jgi:hypothetical protein
MVLVVVAIVVVVVAVVLLLQGEIFVQSVQNFVRTSQNTSSVMKTD